MKILKLTILDGLFTIHHLKLGSALPKGLTSSAFYSISGSSDELSIVAPEALKVESDKSEPGWAAMRVVGTLDFAETGILAELSGVLAKAGVSIFAVSTFDTDYILVKDASLKAARDALTAAGHKISKPRSAKEEEKTSSSSSMFQDSATAILETQIPQIKKLLIEKIGPATLANLRSKTTMAVAVGGIYEFLPTAVRLVVNRELFVSFCVAHLDQLLPQAPTAAKKTTTTPKKTTAAAPTKKK